MPKPRVFAHVYELIERYGAEPVYVVATSGAEAARWWCGPNPHDARPMFSLRELHYVEVIL